MVEVTAVPVVENIPFEEMWANSAHHALDTEWVGESSDR